MISTLKAIHLYNELLFISAAVSAVSKKSDGYWIAKRTTAIRIADQGATILNQGVTTTIVKKKMSRW